MAVVAGIGKNTINRSNVAKKVGFLTISQDEIDNQIKKINGIYRESLMFKCANENYNELCQIN